ncbi:MAG: hypothetical protein ACOYLX_12255 [Burkholderiaceae bacterium]
MTTEHPDMNRRGVVIDGAAAGARFVVKAMPGARGIESLRVVELFDDRGYLGQLVMPTAFLRFDEAVA